MGDLAERARWDDYMAAFEAMLERTSTSWAPWYVIPADRKWFRNVAVSEILADVMTELDPRYPPVDEDVPADLVIE
jgi:polyphosphate kinase 2 (PPK2 family)